MVVEISVPGAATRMVRRCLNS